MHLLFVFLPLFLHLFFAYFFAKCFQFFGYNFATKQQASSGQSAKRGPKLIPEILLTIEQIFENGDQIHQNSEEMVPRECSESDLGSKSVLDFEKDVTSFHKI